MIHMSIDNDEQLEKTCGKCKHSMEESKCVVCGDKMIVEEENNPNFDDAVFEKMKKDSN